MASPGRRSPAAARGGGLPGSDTLRTVFDHLDSLAALQLLKAFKGAKAGLVTGLSGKLRLYTFDCLSLRQENRLAQRCDCGAVRVVRVHFRRCDENMCGQAEERWCCYWHAARHLRRYRDHVYSTSGSQGVCQQSHQFWFRSVRFPRCESVCVLGAPARLLECDVGVGCYTLELHPRGVPLTTTPGTCAVFARVTAPRTVCFRLTVRGLARTFTSVFDGDHERHGSSSFCRVADDDYETDDSDDSDDPDDVGDEDAVDARLDVLRVLGRDAFRVRALGVFS